MDTKLKEAINLLPERVDAYREKARLYITKGNMLKQKTILGIYSPGEISEVSMMQIYTIYQVLLFMKEEL